MIGSNSTALSRRVSEQPRLLRIATILIAPRLQPGHGSKEKDQHADGHERERGAREKLRYPIETLTAPGLHECDQGQNESDTITDQRGGGGGLWGPACRGTRKRTGHQAEPKEEKRRQSKFTQVIHVPSA